MHHNRIVAGDCLEHLQTIPSESIDMAFADPPFNLNKRYGNYHDQQELHAYLEWCRAWLGELVRITKPTGSILVHNIPKWLTYYASFLNELADFKHWIAWDAMSTPLGKSLMPTHYGILYYAKNKTQNKFYEVRYPHKRCRGCQLLHKDYGGKKPKLHPFGPLVPDVWTDLHRLRHPKRRDDHPCQLPETVLERLILMTTDEGDLVLDPFAGTGTTLIAAKRLGRNYIGMELDAEYVALAEEKLAAVRPDSRIGGVWVSKFLNGIATIRDQDWETLKAHFHIPEPIPRLEYQNIILNGEKLRRTMRVVTEIQSPLFFQLEGNASCTKASSPRLMRKNRTGQPEGETEKRRTGETEKTEKTENELEIADFHIR